MKQVKAYVVANRRILPGGPHYGSRALESRIIQLHCPEIASEAKPGQFVMVRCGDECLLPRPFSIHQATDDDISLFFAVLDGGKGTDWLSQRQANDTVELFGPLGNGFSIQSEAHNLLLVAGGMGLAPLSFLAQQATAKKHSVTLLLGAAVSPLYPRKLLPGKIKLVTATEDGSAGRKGKATDIMPEFVGGADQVFACGPIGMYQTMAQMPELKNKPTQVSLEVGMGCGRGVCFSCTVKTKKGLKQVCQDGPVFALDDILWNEPGLI